MPHEHQNLIPIKDSSTIEAVGYHPENGDLHIQFKHGGHYLYHQIEPKVFEQLMGAKSKGKFFHGVIKGRHKFTKLA